ncbi:AMP-binding protein [Nisaea acidiphila]|uniref:AMP-binding protein n=1 Tax=Nisaea acidiphila TaxID=1862145 RepID=A0A9J7AT63_9PROT|nr:AMP-binding protein [Nisaea acidiphila]UUX50050.1 AMP-binding protein [Nisaea acidiphila]
MTLHELLAELAATHPDRPAIVDGDRTVTFSALRDEVDHVASGLAALGLAHGDRIAVWLPNGLPMITLVLGAAKLGAISVIINTRYQKAELEGLLSRTRAKVLALATDFRGIPFLDILEAVPAEKLSHLKYVVNCPPAADIGAPVGQMLSYESLTAATPDKIAPANEQDPCAMFATSGTTRAPKLVMHCQRAIVRHGKDNGQALGYASEGAVMLQALPLCGVFGFSQFMGALANGRPSVFMEAFDSGEALRIIERHRVTHFNATDDMLVRILDEAKPGQLASLREVGFASFTGTNAEALVARAQEEAGIVLRGLFGMSELQALYAAQPADLPVSERAKPGGFPVSAGGAARVTHPETGEVLAPGEIGALEFKGPSRFVAYYEDPEATKEVLSEDGWFSSGDAGELEADGRFLFRGRMGDTLRLGGFLVSAREIEGVLDDHPDVASTQVVGVNDGAVPVAVAFVIPVEGKTPDADALRRHCADHLAKYKVPRTVIPVAEFETVTGPNGTKVQKQKLREIAEQAIRSG